MKTRTIATLALSLLLAPALHAAETAAAPDLEKAISTALVDKLGDDAKTIRVAFYDGKAVLSGKVAEKSTQEIAKEVALWVHGVQKVENQVEASNERPVGAGKILKESDDASLESSVKSLLKKEIGQYASNVEVEACDGVVSLRGRVPDEARAKYALEATKKLANVKKVVDLIDVSG